MTLYDVATECINGEKKPGWPMRVGGYPCPGNHFSAVSPDIALFCKQLSEKGIFCCLHSMRKELFVTLRWMNNFAPCNAMGVKPFLLLQKTALPFCTEIKITLVENGIRGAAVMYMDADQLAHWATQVWMIDMKKHVETLRTLDALLESFHPDEIQELYQNLLLICPYPIAVFSCEKEIPCAKKLDRWLSDYEFHDRVFAAWDELCRQYPGYEDALGLLEVS